MLSALKQSVKNPKPGTTPRTVMPTPGIETV